MTATRALRVMLVANDGFSAGHVARTIAISRALARRSAARGIELRLLLLTTSEADELLRGEPVAIVRLPTPVAARRAGFVDAERRRLTRATVDGVVEGFGPDLIVADTFPSGPHGELSNIGRRAKRALIRRTVADDRNEALTAGLGDHDLAIVADDPMPLHVTLPIPVVHVPPITIAEARDGLDRTAARAALGLPASGRVILVASGGGGDPDAASRARAIADSIARVAPDTTVVLALGPLSGPSGDRLRDRHLPNQEGERLGDRHLPNLEGERLGDRHLPNLEGERLGDRHLPNLEGDRLGDRHLPNLEGDHLGDRHLPNLEGERLGDRHLPNLEGERLGDRHLPNLEGERLGDRHLPNLEGERLGDRHLPNLEGERLGDRHLPNLEGERLGDRHLPNLEGERLRDRHLPWPDAQSGRRTIVITRVAPLQPVLAAFDGAVSAAGYNTACELAKAKVPAVLFAQPRPFDDQAARAERFAAAGFARVIDQIDDDATISDALAWMGSAACPELEPGGSDRAADALLDLATGAR